MLRTCLMAGSFCINHRFTDYHNDLEKVTIEAYRIKLKSAYLPPSRMMPRKDWLSYLEIRDP
jgi:hypothetical protein